MVLLAMLSIMASINRETPMRGTVYDGTGTIQSLYDPTNTDINYFIRCATGCLSASFYNGPAGAITTMTIVRDCYFPLKYHIAVHSDSGRESIYRAVGNLSDVIRGAWGYML